MMGSRRAATLTADYLGSGWTPDSVAAATKVSPLEGANVIEVVAQAPEPDQAAKLSEGYAKATLADRWQTISAELNARVTAITDTIAAAPDNPNVGDLQKELQKLTTLRDGGSDPTMKIDSTSAPAQIKQMSTGVTLAVATVGGLFVGLLASVGAAMVRRRVAQPAEAPRYRAPTPVHSPDDGF
jgi:capsular polysaccharide biosynthesis protein